MPGTETKALVAFQGPQREERLTQIISSHRLTSGTVRKDAPTSEHTTLVLSDHLVSVSLSVKD